MLLQNCPTIVKITLFEVAHFLLHYNQRQSAFQLYFTVVLFYTVGYSLFFCIFFQTYHFVYSQPKITLSQMPFLKCVPTYNKSQDFVKIVKLNLVFLLYLNDILPS